MSLLVLLLVLVTTATTTAITVTVTQPAGSHVGHPPTHTPVDNTAGSTSYSLRKTESVIQTLAKTHNVQGTPKLSKLLLSAALPLLLFVSAKWAKVTQLRADSYGHFCVDAAESAAPSRARVLCPTTARCCLTRKENKTREFGFWVGLIFL